MATKAVFDKCMTEAIYVCANPPPEEAWGVYWRLLKDVPDAKLSRAFDVCFAARRLGLRGGLKNIELELGFPREYNIQGLNGWDAVHLWRAWQAGDEDAGAKLCQYNEADVKNLEILANHIYEEFLQRYGPVSVLA